MDRVAAAVADRDVRYLSANENAEAGGFLGTVWKREVNVRDFIQHNVTPYFDDESFLAAPTERTKQLWNFVLELMNRERVKGGTLDMDTEIVSTIVSHKPGYISQELEQIVGLQTGSRSSAP